MTSPRPSSTTSTEGPGQADLYSTPGLHQVNGRQWSTKCEGYSQTMRCRTDIWATQVRYDKGRLVKENGWFFNNLTYLPQMKRDQWTGNPLASTGSWTAADGRKWRTECDTATTGGNGCRSSVWSRDVVAQPKTGGGFSYTMEWRWVFNNIVRFK